MDFQPFFDAMDKGGLALAILIVIGLAIWKGCRWFAENVVKPIVTTHQSHVVMVAESNKRKDELLEKHGEILERIEIGQEKMAENTHCIANAQNGIVELLKRSSGP